MINYKTLEKLAEIFEKDNDITVIIRNSLADFHKYHSAIYEMEQFVRFRDKDIPPEQFREKVSALDGARTRCHNCVLSDIKILNKLALQSGLSPVYEGTVSAEQPYRREVADAVLEYVYKVIKERV